MKSSAVTFGAFAIGCFGLAYGIHRDIEASAVCKKIDRSYSEVLRMSELELPESAMRAAVAKASEKAVNRIADGLKTDIEGKVRSAVDILLETKRQEMAEQAATEFNDRMALWTDESVKESVKARIVKQAGSRFDSMLEEAKKTTMDNFKARLNDMAKDYNLRMQDADYIRRVIERRI